MGHMPDPATKDDIERVIALTREDIARVREELHSAVERLIALMQDSFGRIDQRFDEFTAHMDTQATRLDRHDGVLHSGSR
jgi:hypothetical protein